MKPTHFERNRQTRPNWDQFCSHREFVTRLLIDAYGQLPTGRKGTTRLCILGAGNCNDLDLNRLTASYDHVVLIDIDQEAMESGIARQAVVGSIETVCCDVTGNDLPECRFDVVASTCLLTQLYVDLDRSTANADQYAGIRRHHFLTMLRMMEPKATGIFITDVVSSDTVPNLEHHDREQLAKQMPQWIHGRNFFTGTNPSVIYQLLTADAEIAPQLHRVNPVSPWLWTPGPRAYACYGMVFNRAT